MMFAWLLAANAVRVLEMSSISSQDYGQSSQNVHVTALVPNLGFEKNVSVIFTRDGGTAQRVIARYLGPAEAGQEVWEAYTNLGPGHHVVAVEYAEASEQDEAEATWFLREGAGPVLFENRTVLALFESPVASRGPVEFHAAIKNLAYQKRVRLHYSSDGWQTTQSIDLSYQRVFSTVAAVWFYPTRRGFEIWSGTLDLSEGPDQIFYYYSYEFAGQTTIDNNFGHNYPLTIR